MEKSREVEYEYALAELTEEIWKLRLQVRALWIIAALMAAVLLGVLLYVF